MLFLLATLAAASTATPSVVRRPPQPRAAEACPAPGITYAQAGSAGHALRRLDDEPPASHYLAVERQIGGCPAPAVVRTGIGK
jgi:hypothetical protein